MAAGLVVKLVGTTALKAKLTPELYLGAIERLLTSLALIGERVARQEAPHDTMALARSIVSEVRPLQATIYSPLSYAAAMDGGRRPGARPPPSDALRGWAKRHGFTGSLFVLARSIGRKGIKGKHFMRAAQTAIEAQFPAMIEDAIQHVRAKWGG